jgi:hypothetical protein
MAVAQKIRADWAWVDLELPSHPNSLALFSIAVRTELGNGNNTPFWTDNWFAWLLGGEPCTYGFR